MSDELDEIESVVESLEESGLPVWHRTPEDAKKVLRVKSENATVRDVADALETANSEAAMALRNLVAVIESLRKEIRQLQNHRHPKDEWYSGKPVL